jgi:tetratricopeptide (TPR) repeat protein
MSNNRAPRQNQPPPGGNGNRPSVISRLSQRWGNVARSAMPGRNNPSRLERIRPNRQTPPEVMNRTPAPNRGRSPELAAIDEIAEAHHNNAPGMPPPYATRSEANKKTQNEDFHLPESLAELGIAPRSRAATQIVTPAGRKFDTTILPSVQQRTGGFRLQNTPPGGVMSGNGQRTFTQTRANGTTQVISVTTFGTAAPPQEALETTQLPPRPVSPKPAAPPPGTPLVDAPIMEPGSNAGRREALENMFRFRDPGLALMAGIFSLITLVMMIALIIIISNNMVRPSSERFTVVVTTFGIGAGYSVPQDNTGGRISADIRDNFVNYSGLTQVELRTSGTIPRNTAAALEAGRRTSADLTVSGYLEPNSNRVFIYATLMPKNTKAFGVNPAWQFLTRYMFDPEQVLLVVDRAALQMGGPSDVTRLMRGLTSYYTGNYEQANADINALLQQGVPENEPGLRMIAANMAVLTGRYEDAINGYRTVENLNQAALRQNRAFPVEPIYLLNNRATAQYLVNRPDEANRSFEAALGVSSNFAKVYANYAQFLLDRTNLDRNPKLIAEWVNRLEIIYKGQTTKNAVIAYNLGRLYSLQAKYDLAAETFRQAYELDPYMVDALTGQARQHLLKFETEGNFNQYGQLEQALALYKAAETRTGNVANGIRQVGVQYGERGNPTMSVLWEGWARQVQDKVEDIQAAIARCYTELARIKGKDAGNPFERVFRWVRSEKTPYEEAVPRVDEALKHRPQDPEVNFTYGQLLYISGNADPKPYWQIAKDNERNPVRRWRYHDILARQYKLSGNVPAAQAEYGQYLQIDPNSERAHLALGNTLLEAGQFAPAVTAADNAIRANPNNPAGYMLAGKALLDNRQPQVAVGYFDRAITLNGTIAEPHYLRARALFDMNQRDQALVSFNRAVTINENVPEAYYYAGIIYLENFKDAPKARDAWEKAVLQRPDYTEAWARLGALYTSLKDYNKAIESYEKAIAASPNDALNYFYQGVVYKGRSTGNDLEKAEGRLKQAIEKQPGLLNAYSVLAQTILERDATRAGEAVEVARRAVTLNGQSWEARAMLGDALRFAGQQDAAIAEYNTALTLRSQYPEALFGRADAQLKKAQYDAALADANAALALRPAYAEPLLVKASAHRAKNQLNEALTNAEAARRLQPNNYQVYLELGQIYQLGNQVNPAIQAFSRGRELNPRYVVFHNRLGELYTLTNRVDDAIAILEEGRKIQAGVARQHYLLGRAYALKGRYTDAQASFEAMIKQNPTMVEAHYELGNVLRVNGNRERAVTEYQESVKLQPAFWQGWLALGQVFQDLNRTPEAREAYQRAVASPDPKVREAAQTLLNSLR